MKKTQGGFLISQAKQLGSRVFERLLKEQGVDSFNGAQGRILYVLWEHGQLNITQIGKLTSLAKTTLTGMLDRMEAAGLVERMHYKSNRRQIIITITDKTRALSADYEKVSQQMGDIYYAGFADDEIAAFEGMLQRILSNLESHEKENPL